jgi:predicted O-methyltransferase YrrM
MDKKTLTSQIFNTLRILKGVTPQDDYYTQYLWHLKERGDNFFDIYHLAFWWGANKNPKNIMEIGARTGLSLAQLLSGCLDYTNQRIVIFDRFDDGFCSPELIKKHLDYLFIPHENIEFYTGDSRETVPEFKKFNPNAKFDWILVDGGHLPEYVKPDLENVVDMIAKGGVIVVDDICAEPELGIDVRSEWENFKKKYFDQFEWREDANGKGTGWAIKL